MGEMKIEAEIALAGLTEAEAARRLAESGPNRVAAPRISRCGRAGFAKLVRLP